MDYKKKYNKAQKWIESIYPELSHEQQMEAEAFFPELRESEDERVRKEILSLVRYTKGRRIGYEPRIHQDKMIAWLEKQGEHVEINPTEFDLRLNRLLKQFETLPKEELVSSLGFYLNVVQNDGTYKADEKQGEQPKEATYNHEVETGNGNIKALVTGKVKLPKFEIGDEIKTDNEDPLTITRIDEQGYWSEDLFICSFEDSAKWELVGKFVNKVETKFHEGDFIKHNKANIICKVISVNSSSYYVENIETSGRIELFNAGRNFHLWTIQDAKDGDVLASKNGLSILIFRNLDTSTSFSSYYNIQGKGELGWSNECFIPATKSQRNTLFAKMKEAGYTFDFKKKELKKIGSIYEYEGLTDFERTLADICIGWIGQELGWKQYIKDNADILLKIAIKMFNSIQDTPFEQKPTDNDMVEALRTEYEKGRADVLRCIDPDEMVADFYSQPLSKTRSLASIYRQGIMDVLKRINNNEETSIISTCSIDDGVQLPKP